MKRVLLLLFFVQGMYIMAQPWLSSSTVHSDNFFDIREGFNAYWKGREVTKGSGYKPFRRWEWYWETRINKDGSFPSSSVTWDNWHEYLNTHPEISAQYASKTQAGPNWAFKGPSTTPGGYNGLGRINCMAFHPTNPNTFWVGSPAGGLWKTTNGGTSWSTTTDLLPVLGVSDIAIDPVNPNIMYIATGDGDMGNLHGLTNGAVGDTKSIGVLKSTDGGNTWSTTGLNWNVTSAKLIRRLIINPNNPQILMAAASDGIWRTINGGANWTNVQSGYFMDLEFKPTDPNYVYASTYDSQGAAEIYRSIDGGVNWTLTMQGSNVIRIDLAVSPNAPSIVDVVCVDTQSGLEGLYLSTNSGASYTLYFGANCTNNLLNWSYNASGCGGQGHYDLAYALNPNDANDIWLGGINVWNSTNGGTTFSPKTMWTADPSHNPSNIPEVHADVHFIAFHPLQSNTMFVCNDGGIYKTTNAGTSWTDLSNGLQISQIYRIGVAQTAPENVIIGLQDNGTRETYNNTWYERTGGDGMDCAIDYTDDMIQYASYVNGKIYATSDWWSTQSVISDNISNPAPEGAWVTPFSIDPTTPTVIYAGYDVIYKSTNRGLNWSQISPVLSSDIKLRSMMIAPSNSNYIYAASFDTLFLTTNGGANWFYSNTLIGTSPITHIAVDPLNPQNVYCTIGRYVAGNKVFKSTDAGVTWTNISGTLPNLPVNCILYERGSNERLYIGTDAGVFYKEASMNDWVYYNTGLPNVVVTELEILYQDNKLWAATFGRGLWNSDLAGTPPPNAAFTANVTQICPGDCVNFIDNSSQTPTSWSWSFPGANTSSSNQQNPSNICYPSFGTYTVSLTATNGSGSGSTTQNGFIVVGSGPGVPQIQANPAPGFCPGNSAVLTVPNPCSGCSFSWSPGGQTGTSITVSNSGTHTVTASNSCGQAVSTPIVITAFPTPNTPLITINGNMLISSQASSYQWYLNGSLISGATQQMYLPTQAGNYTVEVTDVNNCISVSGILFFTPTSRDTDNYEESSKIVLFPNPAFDYIDLIIKDAALSDKFVVINILGEMMFEFQPTELNAIHRLDVSKLPTGNYILSYVGLNSVEFKKFSVIR